MRILLVSPLPPPNGGIASWTEGYKEYCEKNEIPLNIINSGIIGSRITNFVKVKISEELKRVSKIIKEAKSIVKKDKFDVAHINISCSRNGMIREYLLVKMFAKKKIPIAIECHCNVEDQVKSKLSKYLLKKIISKTNKVIVLNNQSKKYVDGFFQTTSIIIPNFITTELTDIRKCNEEIKEILFVGHVVKTKGCLNIISISKKFPDINFTLVGNISDEIKKIDIPNNVKLVGEVLREQALYYMQRCDLFLFPTYSEGFPLVILEAMSVGLPIITTKVGAIEDMLGNNDCYFAVGDEQGMIDLIIKMQSQKKRQAMSNWEINELKNKFTIGRVMDEYFKVYEELK